MADTVPILDSTFAAHEIKTTSCKTAGNITSDGGQAIIERGICYGLYANPTISNSKVIDSLAEIGSFEATLGNLSINTTYYVRSYAINSIGTGYGSQMTFKTLLNPSLEEIKDLNFGYLTGQDLLRFIQYQMLIKQGSVDIESLQYSVNMAYSEFRSNFQTLYDCEEEFAKTGNDRSQTAIKLVSLLAIRNLCGNLTQVTDYLASLFTWLDDTIKNIRLGQITIDKMNTAPQDSFSDVNIVTNNFSVIG